MCTKCGYLTKNINVSTELSLREIRTANSCELQSFLYRLLSINCMAMTFLCSKRCVSVLAGKW